MLPFGNVNTLNGWLAAARVLSHNVIRLPIPMQRKRVRPVVRQGCWRQRPISRYLASISRYSLTLRYTHARRKLTQAVACVLTNMDMATPVQIQSNDLIIVLTPFQCLRKRDWTPAPSPEFPSQHMVLEASYAACLVLCGVSCPWSK